MGKGEKKNFISYSRYVRNRSKKKFLRNHKKDYQKECFDFKNSKHIKQKKEYKFI